MKGEKRCNITFLILNFDIEKISNIILFYFILLFEKKKLIILRINIILMRLVNFQTIRPLAHNLSDFGFISEN